MLLEVSAGTTENGDEVDLDALFEAIADARSGHELSDRVFTQPHRVERPAIGPWQLGYMYLPLLGFPAVTSSTMSCSSL